MCDASFPGPAGAQIRVSLDNAWLGGQGDWCILGVGDKCCFSRVALGQHSRSLPRTAPSCLLTVLGSSCTLGPFLSCLSSGSPWPCSPAPETPSVCSALVSRRLASEVFSLLSRPSCLPTALLSRLTGVCSLLSPAHSGLSYASISAPNRSRGSVSLPSKRAKTRGQSGPACGSLSSVSRVPAGPSACSPRTPPPQASAALTVPPAKNTFPLLCFPSAQFRADLGEPGVLASVPRTVSPWCPRSEPEDSVSSDPLPYSPTLVCCVSHGGSSLSPVHLAGSFRRPCPVLGTAPRALSGSVSLSPTRPGAQPQVPNYQSEHWALRTVGLQPALHRCLWQPSPPLGARQSLSQLACGGAGAAARVSDFN